MTIARVHTLTNVNVRNKDVMYDELDNIVSYLDGSATDEVIIVVDDDVEAPLTLMSLGKNPCFDIRKNNVSQVYLGNKDGSIESLISTGVAPFDIISTTKCTNVNLHYLDGIDGDKFNSKDLPEENYKGKLTITKHTSGVEGLEVVCDAESVDFNRSSNGSNLFSFNELNQSKRKIETASTFNVQLAYDPFENESTENNTNFDALRYIDLLDSSKILYFSGILNSVLAGATDDTIGAWICGMPIDGICTLRKLVVYKGSAGDIVVELLKNGSVVATLSIPSASAVNEPFLLDINISANEDDVFVLNLANSTGNQNYVCAGVLGKM